MCMYVCIYIYIYIYINQATIPMISIASPNTGVGFHAHAENIIHNYIIIII